jgi:hypothetical protein
MGWWAARWHAAYGQIVVLYKIIETLKHCNAKRDTETPKGNTESNEMVKTALRR